jgi:hypothetical protein
MATVTVRFHWSRERLFYGGMGLFVLLCVLAGFAQSWFLRGVTGHGPPLPLLVHVHGAVFLSWVLLFVAQGALISARAHRWHRRLGFASIALAAAIVVLGVLVSLGQYRRGSGPPGIDPLSWLAVPLIDMLFFAGLVAAGVAWRGRPQVHKRLMLVATLLFLQAALGRFQPFPPGFLNGEGMTLVAFAPAFALVAWDLAQRGRVHPATIAGIAALGTEQLLRIAVWETEGWKAVARGIVGAAG